MLSGYFSRESDVYTPMTIVLKKLAVIKPLLGKKMVLIVLEGM